MGINLPPKKPWFAIFWTKFRSRFKTKRPFSLTRPGWVFILYTIGVGAGAINTGNNLLYLVFGLFLGLILASGVLSDLSLWGLEATVSMPHFATVQQPFFIHVHIKNNKRWIPSLSVRVALEAEVDGEWITTEIYIPTISALGHLHTQFVLVPPSRGRLRVRRIKFLTRFPFGLLLKWWTHWDSEFNVEDRHSNPYESLVCPETYELSARALSKSFEIMDSLLSIDKLGDGVTLLGVRPHQSSDPLRRIHWKASAKRHSTRDTTSSSWLVKELDSDGKEATQFQWPSPQQLRVFHKDQFETFVSFAASVIRFFERQKRPMTFYFDLGLGAQFLMTKDLAVMKSLLALTRQQKLMPETLEARMSSIPMRKGLSLFSLFEKRGVS